MGDIVEVTVLSVDQEKKRISLTMREEAPASLEAEKARAPQGGRQKR